MPYHQGARCGRNDYAMTSVCVSQASLRTQGIDLPISFGNTDDRPPGLPGLLPPRKLVLVHCPVSSRLHDALGGKGPCRQGGRHGHTSYAARCVPVSTVPVSNRFDQIRSMLVLCAPCVVCRIHSAVGSPPFLLSQLGTCRLISVVLKVFKKSMGLS